MAPSSSHWDRRVADGDLRFLNLPNQHHVRVLPEEYLKNWILMKTTSRRRIRIQRHAFVHLACLVSSVAVFG